MAQGGPAFSAYANAAQSVPAATMTKLIFQVEEFDTDNCFDNATNYRFQPTVAGYYQIQGAFSMNGANTERIISIYKNGSPYKYGNDNGTAYVVTAHALVYLNGSTDYVELWGYTATATSTNAGSAAATWFQGFLARPA